MIKILLTSAGSLVGYNVLDVLEGRRRNLQVIGTNSVETDANIYRCDKAYLLPATNHKRDFVIRLKEIQKLEQPDLIIPCRDIDISILAELKKQNQEFVNICLSGNEKSAKTLLDKWVTFNFALSNKLPFADSAIPNPETKNSEVKNLLKKYGFPLLTKPRDGYASCGVFIVSNEKQLEKALKKEHIIIQQYLSSPKAIKKFTSQIQNEGVPLFYSHEEEKYSIQTFVNRDGTIGDIFCTLHKMVSGRSLKVKKIKNEKLEKVGLNYAKAMASEGWFGPLNIQCQQQHPNEFTAYELNGRFTGATSARYHLGFDEVGNALNNLLGLNIQNNRIQILNSDQVSRYVTTKPIPYEDRKKFRKQGCWQST